MQALLKAQKVVSDTPRPVAGWPLPVAMDIDEAVPGFMRWLMRASRLRRQVFALVAAEILECGTDDVGQRLNADGAPLEAIGTALTSWSAQQIVSALLDSIPDGFIGALSKIGDSPLAKKDGYRLLHELLAKGGPERGSVVRQATSVQYGMITQLLRLDPLLCRAGFVHKLTSASQVEGANNVVKLARAFAGADDARIVSSAADQEDVEVWAKKWFERMESLQHVVPALGDEFKVLSSAAQLKDAARRYRNCGKTRIPFIALGREVIVEHEELEVLVVLTTMTEGRYMLDSLWGPSNSRPPAHVAKRIVCKLLDAGILAQAGRLQPQVHYSTLRLVGAWEEHRRFFDANAADDEGEDEAA